MLSSANSDRRPTDGLGSRLDRIKGRARRELWRKRVAMTPSGTRDVLNDALSKYFGNPPLRVPWSPDGVHDPESRPGVASSRARG